MSGLSSRSRTAVGATMKAVLEGGEVALLFQPQVDLRDGRVLAVEALVRWQHPDRGLLSAGELLCRIEQAGAMLALTEVVLDGALAQLASWISAGRSPSVSINVPPDIMAIPGFDVIVGEALSRHGVPGKLLRLEITEQDTAASWPDLTQAIIAMATLDVTCSLDDLGTGSASLQRLAELDVAEAKLDLELIQAITKGPRHRECVGAAIGLAHRLGMHVVAEGVEDQATLRALTDLGCDAVQGFLFAKPMPANEVELVSFQELITVPANPTSHRPVDGGRRLTSPPCGTAQRPIRGSVIVAAGYLAVYLLWHLLREPGWGHQALIGDLFFVPLNAWAVTAAYRAGDRARSVPRLQRGWRLMATGLAAYLVGDLLQTWYEVGLQQKPYPGPADAAYLSFYPFMVAGTLMLSSKFAKGARAALALDVATVTVGASAVVWYFVLGPTAAAGGDLFTVGVSIAYPVGDIVVVLAAVFALLRGGAMSSRTSLHILLGCLAAFVVTDLVYGWLLLHATYTGGDIVDSGWVVALAGVAVAAAAQATPDLAIERRSVPRSTGAGALTFVAVLVSCVLLLTAGAKQQIYPLGGLIVVAVALTALVSLRQGAALRAHARLAAEYRRLVAVDVLTGLSSRRSLLEDGEDLFAAAQQRDGALSVLVIDLDHFKAINDAYGHAAGDRVLIAVAAACRTTMPTALIGRYGGDELVAVLPDIEPGQARDLGDTLVRTVAAITNSESADSPAVTVSIGVACAKGHRDFDAVLAAADHALYDAKASGRACTRVAAPIPVPL